VNYHAKHCKLNTFRIVILVQTFKSIPFYCECDSLLYGGFILGSVVRRQGCGDSIVNESIGIVPLTLPILNHNIMDILAFLIEGSLF